MTTAPKTAAESPWIDSRILQWQRSLCGNPISWEIYWRIRYWERQNNGQCFDKPSDLMTGWGVPEKSFYRAIKAGEKAGIFRRVGKARSHLGRSWETVVQLLGFDEEGSAITACLLRANPDCQKPPTTRSEVTDHSVKSDSELGQKRQTHIEYSIKSKELELSVCKDATHDSIESSNSIPFREGEKSLNEKSLNEALLDILLPAISEALIDVAPYPPNKRDLFELSSVAGKFSLQAAKQLISSGWLAKEASLARSRRISPRDALAMSRVCPQLKIISDKLEVATRRSLEAEEHERLMAEDKIGISIKKHLPDAQSVTAENVLNASQPHGMGPVVERLAELGIADYVDTCVTILQRAKKPDRDAVILATYQFAWAWSVDWLTSRDRKAYLAPFHQKTAGHQPSERHRRLYDNYRREHPAQPTEAGQPPAQAGA